MRVNEGIAAKMKHIKLIVHTAQFSEEDLIISPKDFPNATTGDILEIYHNESDFSRLLLQVTSLKDTYQKDTISIKSSIATTFQLRTFTDVVVNKVNVKDVALDSAEITFKDQYLGRSDMWRLKKNVENTCAYLNKKIEFCGIRCEVYEMWAQGERVACGVITEDTKIVFRSSTSQVYLFIQMSSEMWDTDIYGDLYFEKAVNGFLADLFLKWKKNGSSHEVTIVLFSRTYYEAQSIEEFPEYMRECLHQDYKGHFYEDFYRVAVQNERYEDWAIMLVELKRLFNKYPSSVLEYHHGLNGNVPKAVNSTAAQGNFLEVLNMSLNVFEKHYLDRSFDRTGQLSVVITPGVGVFEVDRELTHITKQRIIDNGVGSDLVCLGEQPLHAVPLFKFHNKNVLNAVDDYSMPHWINLSFYSGNKQPSGSNFVPRIKLPVFKVKPPKELKLNGDLISRPKDIKPEEDSIPTLIDYDAYDAQIFKVPSAHISGPHSTHSLQRMPNRKKSDQTSHHQPKQMTPCRKFSEADITLFQSDASARNLSRSAAINIPSFQSDQSSSSSSSTNFNTEPVAPPKPRQTSAGDDWEEEMSPARTIIGSAGSSLSPQGSRGPLLRPGRALINPFDPSHVTIKLTSNRRRWTHVFPLGPTGIFMQQHHYQAVPYGTSSNNEIKYTYSSPSGSQDISFLSMEARRKRSVITPRPIDASELEKDKDGSSSCTTIEIPCRTRSTPSRSSVHPGETISADRSLILLWGATGEQEWTPALTTGVDWKSLTIPACLPLTTDYFPDSRSLQNDYVVSDYTLLPEEVNAEFTQQKEHVIKPLTTEEVFEELVSQRLQQGFQQIVFPKPLMSSSHVQASSSPHNSSFIKTRSCMENGQTKEIVLSIGRIFHKVSLSTSTITVTCFRPRHPYPTMNIHYLYRFQAPHMGEYDISWVNFKSEKLESYNWNYLDHYICWRGQGDFILNEFLKYWRFRMFLVPIQLNARKLLEEKEHFNIYQPPSSEETIQMVDGFLKFLEIVNRLKKPVISRKTRKSGTFVKPIVCRIGSQSQIVPAGCGGPAVSPSQLLGVSVQTSSNPQFRDRLGSNRGLDRPRARSGSKVFDRVRSESGNGGRASPSGEIVDSKQISISSLSLDTGTESLTTSQPDTADEHSSSSTQSSLDCQKLSTNSSLSEIMESMKQSNDSVSFFSRQQRLPAMTFISAEAVLWIMEHVENANCVNVAIEILEKMLSEKMICHASGNKDHGFVFGFYLYYVVDNTEKDPDDSWQPTGDLTQFQKEWIEVRIDPSTLQCSDSSTVRYSYLDRLPELYCELDDLSQTHDSVYNEGNLEMEPSEKITRAEWGHTRFHRIFIPGVAFELTVQWMVATSSIITEVVQNWTRKANVYGFHLVPIPSDPFAFPFSFKSDPLRGPIFIPLNCDVLFDDVHFVYFEELNRKECAEQIFRFQEAIVQQFGFVSCYTDGGKLNTQYQYVHTTGNVFVMITGFKKEKERGMRIAGRKGSPKVSVTSMSSPHESYITRHVMGKSTKKILEEKSCQRQKIGFYWSWNYMLTKRWRISPACDEQLANKLFRDFLDFCKNDRNRLKSYWQDWQQVNNMSEFNVLPS